MEVVMVPRDDVRVSATAGSGVNFEFVNSNVAWICIATCCDEHELDCTKNKLDEIILT